MKNRKVGPPSRRPTNRRFADPWAFRERFASRRGPSADLYGRPIETRRYRRSGRPVEVPVPLSTERQSPRPVASALQELRRRVAAELVLYESDGLCSKHEIRLIRALWQDGVSLRAFARSEGVTGPAISQRIERLKERCPRFYRYWILKNRRRRRDRWV